MEYEDIDTIFLEIKLINEKTDKNVQLKDFLQVNYHLTYYSEKTEPNRQQA